MVVCAVSGCRNSPDNKNSEKKLRFHYFPKDATMCKMWISACGNKAQFSLKHSRICSEHFVESDYKLRDILLNIPENKRSLKKESVPSKNLPNPCEQSSRDKRQERRENKRIVNECVDAFESCQKPSENPPDEEELNQQGCIYYTNGSTQTEFKCNDCSKELRIMELVKEVSRLKKNLKRKNEQTQKDEAIRTAMRTSLREIFTPIQIDQLEHPNKRARWQADDISSAMSLYSAGARSYRLLRKRNFPLPAPSTLRSWAKQIEIKPGVELPHTFMIE